MKTGNGWKIIEIYDMGSFIDDVTSNEGKGAKMGGWSKKGQIWENILKINSLCV